MYPIKVINKKKFILCYFDAFIVNLCIYLMPLLLAIFTTAPFTLEKFFYLILSIISLKIIQISLNHIWVIYILKFEDIYKKDLELAYFNRIIKMNICKLNNLHNGFLKKQISILSEEAIQFLQYIFETVNGFIIASTIFLIQVFSQDRKLFLVCVGMIMAMVMYNLWLGKKSVTVQEEYNNEYSKYNAIYVDFLQNIRAIKRLEAIDYANKKNEESFNNVIPKMKKTNFFYSLRSNGISFFVYAMYSILLISLYFQMQRGVDILPQLLFYTTMFNGLSGELKDLSSLFMHFNKFQAANKQLEHMIGKQEEKNVIKEWKTIEIKDVTFQYEIEDSNKIYIPYFVLNKGDKVSIVGKSGQGKTTFLNIFSRYLEVEKEKYKIDQKTTQGILDLVYISQEIELFNLSIRDNLCLGKDISETILRKYLAEAGLLEWIDGLEKGLETIVGERGVKLSAGQKQRLNIIRGILIDKEIYILDEPTSNLDKTTEKLIIQLIEKYLSNKTILIVTHRDEIKAICNKHYCFTENTMQLEAKTIVSSPK